MSPPSPTVSVVVPAFNGADLIDRCIRSLLVQEGERVEVIVVDDGSTDATVDVVAAHPGVHLVTGRHAGVAAARSQGVGLAGAPLIGFCDQDDEWKPAKAHRQAEHLRANPPTAAVLCRQEVVFDDVDTPAWLLPTAAGELGGVLPLSGLFRAEALASARGFDADLRRGNDDFDLLVRLREAGARIDVLDDALMVRHVHQANTSNQIGSYAPGMIEVLRRHVRRSRV